MHHVLASNFTTLFLQHLSDEVCLFDHVKNLTVEMSGWLRGGSIMGFSSHVVSLGKMHGCLSMGDFTLLPQITKGPDAWDGYTSGLFAAVWIQTPPFKDHCSMGNRPSGNFPLSLFFCQKVT